MSLFAAISARCHLCHRDFDPSVGHDLHDDGCTRASGVCRCDLMVCPACCPECSTIVPQTASAVTA